MVMIRNWIEIECVVLPRTTKIHVNLAAGSEQINNDSLQTNPYY